MLHMIMLRYVILYHMFSKRANPHRTKKIPVATTALVIVRGGSLIGRLKH